MHDMISLLLSSHIHSRGVPVPDARACGRRRSGARAFHHRWLRMVEGYWLLRLSAALDLERPNQPLVVLERMRRPFDPGLGAQFKTPSEDGDEQGAASSAVGRSVTTRPRPSRVPSLLPGEARSADGVGDRRIPLRIMPPCWWWLLSGPHRDGEVARASACSPDRGACGPRHSRRRHGCPDGAVGFSRIWIEWK
jgi:hypothetical protein